MFPAREGLTEEIRGDSLQRGSFPALRRPTAVAKPSFTMLVAALKSALSSCPQWAHLKRAWVLRLSASTVPQTAQVWLV